METTPKVSEEQPSKKEEKTTASLNKFEESPNEIASTLSAIFAQGQQHLIDQRGDFLDLYRSMITSTTKKLTGLNEVIKTSGGKELTETEQTELKNIFLNELGRPLKYEIIGMYLKSLALISSNLRGYFQHHLEQKLKEFDSIDNAYLKKLWIKDKINRYLMEDLDPEFLIDMGCSPDAFEKYLKSSREKGFLNKSNILSVMDVTETDQNNFSLNDWNDKHELLFEMMLIGPKIERATFHDFLFRDNKSEKCEYRIQIKDFRQLSTLSIEEPESMSVNGDSISFVSKNKISNTRRIIGFKINQQLSKEVIKPYRSYLGVTKGRNIKTLLVEFQTESEDLSPEKNTCTWLLTLQINEKEEATGLVREAIVSLLNLSSQKKYPDPDIVFQRNLEDYSPQQLSRVKLKKSSNNLAVILILNDISFVYFPIASAKQQMVNNKKIASIKFHEGNLAKEKNVSVYEYDLCEMSPQDKESVKLFRVTESDTIIYDVVADSDRIKAIWQAAPRDPMLKEIKSRIEGRSTLIYNMKHHLEIFKDSYKLYVFACSARMHPTEKSPSKKRYALYVNFTDTSGMSKEFTFDSWLHYDMNHTTPPKIFVEDVQKELLDSETQLSRFAWVITASLLVVVFEIRVDKLNKKDVRLVAGPTKINFGDLPLGQELDMVCPLEIMSRFPALAIINPDKRMLQAIELRSTFEIEREKDMKQARLQETSSD
jgi:hypothetical protein